MTGVAKHTILKLLADLGSACAVYQDRVLQNLTCRRIQVDEIWQFCYAKEKNVPQDRKGQFGYGDVWTWVALDADTKLVPCWVIGDRSADSASLLMRDLASRLRYRVQLTTDGHRAYLTAVEEAFGADINFSQLIQDLRQPSRTGFKVQPRRVHRLQTGTDRRPARPVSYFHELRRKAESYDAHVYAPVHSPH